MSKILRRPMFRGGGKVSSYGNGIATGLGYKNGGRTGYAGGGQIGGGEIYGKRFSDGRYGFAKPSAYVEGYNRIYGSGTGSGARTASTGAGIVESAAAKQGLRSPNFFTRQLVNARNTPYLRGVVNPLLKLGTAGITGTASALATAGAAGYGAGSIADYVTKSGDTPEAYAYRKEASEANPFLFDETSSAGEEAYINEQGELIQGDELDTFTRELTQKDQGEKYGFMPRGGKAQRLKDLGLEGKFDAKTGERIKEQEVVENPQEEIPKNKKQQDPEKSLMDIYGENKGIIDQVMGNSDEDTKKSLYLQLAKFGAGLAAQPGGDLVGAIGKAAMPAIAGTEKTLADKRKGDREVKLMALSKTFEDMKQPEQVKLVKAIQKEFGFDTFKEAYEYISKQKKSGAQLRDEDKFYRETAKEMGVSTDGFRREMQALDEMGLGKYVGSFTRPDALLPEDIDDRVPGEYYVNTKGKPLRFIDGKLYGPKEKQFTKKIETKET